MGESWSSYSGSAGGNTIFGLSTYLNDISLTAGKGGEALMYNGGAKKAVLSNYRAAPQEYL